MSGDPDARRVRGRAGVRPYDQHRKTARLGEVTTYDLSFTALGTVDAIWSEDLAQVDYATRYDNGYSLVDAEGNALTSSTYASITSIYGGYARVELNGKYGLIDLEGNEVLPCAYDDVRYSYYMPTDAEGETYGYNAPWLLRRRRGRQAGLRRPAGEHDLRAGLFRRRAGELRRFRHLQPTSRASSTSSPPMASRPSSRATRTSIRCLIRAACSTA